MRITSVGGVLRSPIAPPNAQPPLTVASVQWLERTVYVGQLLNQPTHLTSVRQGASVRFVHAPGLPLPLLVTPQYEAERARWAFTPCTQCGADQALDPMSVMAKTRFPNAPQGAVPVAFSAFCPCGGTMMLMQVEGAPAAMPTPSPNAFGASAGSFTAPKGIVAPVDNSPSATRVFLIAGVGCLSLVSMCCLSGIGGFFYARGGQESAATAHAERFLGLVQARDWNGALAASEYMGDTSLYSVDSFSSCMQATALAEMTAYRCESASSEWPLDNGADAICTITTSRGETEITVGVNSTGSISARRPRTAFARDAQPFGCLFNAQPFGCTSLTLRRCQRASASAVLHAVSDSDDSAARRNPSRPRAPARRARQGAAIDPRAVRIGCRWRVSW